MWNRVFSSTRLRKSTAASCPACVVSPSSVCEDVVEHSHLRKCPGVNSIENGNRIVVSTVTPVRSGKKNTCVDKCTWHLFFDAPRIVLVLDICRLLAIVAVEVAERAASLPDNLDVEGPVVCNLPAEFVAVADVEFPSDTSRNLSLTPRNCAL